MLGNVHVDDWCDNYFDNSELREARAFVSEDCDCCFCTLLNTLQQDTMLKNVEM